MLVYRTKIYYDKIPSVNNAWRATQKLGLVPTEAFKKFKAVVSEKIYKEYMNREVIGSRLLVIIKLGFTNYIKRDVDNYNKVILDTFKEIVFADDSQVDVLLNTKTMNVKKEYFEIIIDDDISSIFNLRNYLSNDEIEEIKESNKYQNKADKKKDIVTPTSAKDTLGKKIKILRDSKKWTLKHLAKKLEIEENVLIHFETDIRKPTKKMVKKIETLFGLGEGFLESMIKR